MTPRYIIHDFKTNLYYIRNLVKQADKDNFKFVTISELMRRRAEYAKKFRDENRWWNPYRWWFECMSSCTYQPERVGGSWQDADRPVSEGR